MISPLPSDDLPVSCEELNELGKVLDNTLLEIVVMVIFFWWKEKNKQKTSSLILSIPIMWVWRCGVQDFQWWLNLDLVGESATLQDDQEEDKEWKRTVGHGDAEQCFDTCLKQLEQQKATQINLMLLHNVNTEDQREQKTATHQPYIFQQDINWHLPKDPIHSGKLVQELVSLALWPQPKWTLTVRTELYNHMTDTSAHDRQIGWSLSWKFWVHVAYNFNLLYYVCSQKQPLK